SGRAGFAIDVDLVDHEVIVAVNDGRIERVALAARPVADFYHELMGRLHALDIDPAITIVPSEVENPIPFPQDTIHAAYAPEWAHRFWRVLARIDLVLKEHRGRFVGRTTPVSFWWGTFDLSLARYSGRPVRPPEGAGIIGAWVAMPSSAVSGSGRATRRFGSRPSSPTPIRSPKASQPRLCTRRRRP